MNITLYEVSEELVEVLDLIDEDGVIPEETSKALLKFEEKSLAVAAYILNENSKAGMIEDAISKLQSKLKSIQNRNNSLKEYLKFNMKRTGIKKIENPLFKISLDIDRDRSVEITDLSKIPKEYLKQQEPRADKASIKAAIEDGVIIDGASLVCKDRLTIK